MKSIATTCLFLLTACKASGQLEIDQERLDWGEVDFHTEECMDCSCADGCGLTPILLNNTGEGPLEIEMPNGFDDNHICIDGYDSTPNLSLGTLQPGEFFLLNVSICGYLPGELNTAGEDPPREVTGKLRFATDGTPSMATVDFSFIPVRRQE